MKTITFTVPLEDGRHKPIIHEGQQPGEQFKYGLVYIFFGACAGHVVPTTPSSPNGIPMGCENSSGESLGPDDFVPGYTSLYVYDNVRNANPVIDDFRFDGKSILGSPGLQDSDGSSALQHIPRCVPGTTCRTYDIAIDLDKAKNQEIDDLSVDTAGNKFTEQMWLAYYSTDGSFDHPLRLVNDAIQGWNTERGSNFTAPTEPGPVRIWAVVHDNRGGVAWLEGKIIVD